MVDFFRRALRKLDKLNTEQRNELLSSAIGEINLFENVLNSIDMGILVCDESDNLIMVNKCALRLIPMNYIEGVKLRSAITDEKIVEMLKDILANRERVTDKEIDVQNQGRNRLLSVNIVPLVEDKRITGTLIYVEDITEKRKGEARLRRAENLASLTTLAAGVAHEIKNPLGSISIHLQLLQKALAKKIDVTDGKTDKYFDVLKEEVDRLNRIVVDFLFAVRPMNLELREGDLNKLISQIMDFVRFEMEQSKIMCLLELDENLPKIQIDERYMKQAILNLVKNAQAAMPEGGVFTIATNFVDNEIRILICDTGNGIENEYLSKIFEPYFTTRETGTGLGLTQVYKIIREHNGEIIVDSQPQTGTEFKISLPLPQKETKLLDFTESNSNKGDNP
ncbi:MAG: ATP-binding protein [Treponema sp.]|nr:ATP-binding protein [Treponema sp.]MCL2236810.1 ATP-binding protein [Treponema sp.]